MLCVAILVLGLIPSTGDATSGPEIDVGVDNTLHSFESQIPGARELGQKAAGILVFPSVYKAGFGIGGEYGEGLLIIHGRPGGYYNLISASFGFQIGVQARSVIIMFMTQDALTSFQRIYGWKAGVDGSIALVTLGTGGSLDTENITESGHRVHSRPERPDVQFDVRGIQDHPDFPLVGNSPARQCFLHPDPI